MDWIFLSVGALFLACIIVGSIRGAVKIAVSLAVTGLTFLLVFFLMPYVSRAISSFTAVDNIIEEQVIGAIGNAAVEKADIPKDMQIAAIEGADIPEIFRSLLLTNNNDEMYKELGVKTFAEYVAKFLAALIINILSFFITLILTTFILRAVIFALDVFSRLPGIGFLNHLAGGVLGAGGALIIVWVAFVVITMLYTTDIGKEMYRMIQSNSFLKLIYEYNPIMNLAVTLR